MFGWILSVNNFKRNKQWHPSYSHSIRQKKQPNTVVFSILSRSNNSNMNLMKNFCKIYKLPHMQHQQIDGKQNTGVWRDVELKFKKYIQIGLNSRLLWFHVFLICFRIHLRFKRKHCIRQHISFQRGKFIEFIRNTLAIDFIVGIFQCLCYGQTSNKFYLTV